MNVPVIFAVGGIVDNSNEAKRIMEVLFAFYVLQTLRLPLKLISDPLWVNSVEGTAVSGASRFPGVSTISGSSA